MSTGIISIQLSALEHNYRRIEVTVNPSKLTASAKPSARHAVAASPEVPPYIAAVVKADAYGLGAGKVIPELLKAGCQAFCTVTLDEAIAARAFAPTAEIIALGGLDASRASDYFRYGITPACASLSQIRCYLSAAKEAPAGVHPAPCWVQVDTGLARLGLSPEEVETLVQELPALMEGVPKPPAPAAGCTTRPNSVSLIRGVMTHPATADEESTEFLEQQRSRFVVLADKLEAALYAAYPEVHNSNASCSAGQVSTEHAPPPQLLLRSMANSAAVFQGPQYHFDMVRPGMALYGLNPLPFKKNMMSRTVTLRTPVIMTRDVPAGVPVGYNGRFTTARPSCLATCQLGYADGVIRQAYERGTNLMWAPEDCFERPSSSASSSAPTGRQAASSQACYACPIVGAVSMDLVVIDITDVPLDVRPTEGCFMELVGPHQSLDDVAKACGTIGHEILTATRFPREYLAEPSHLKAPPKEITPRAASYIYGLTDLLHKLLSNAGVRYYLEGGSMLGQTRDGGIIRFDDDADVQIHYDDAQRLRDAIPTIEEGLKAWCELTKEVVHLRPATFGYKLILEPTRPEESWELYFDTLGGCWAPGFAIVDLFLTELSDDGEFIQYSDHVIEQQVRGRGYGDIRACRLQDDQPVLADFGPIQACVLTDPRGACIDVFGENCLGQVVNKDGTSFERRHTVRVNYDEEVLNRLRVATLLMEEEVQAGPTATKKKLQQHQQSVVMAQAHGPTSNLQPRNSRMAPSAAATAGSTAVKVFR